MEIVFNPLQPAIIKQHFSSITDKYIFSFLWKNVRFPRFPILQCREVSIVFHFLLKSPNSFFSLPSLFFSVKAAAFCFEMAGGKVILSGFFCSLSSTTHISNTQYNQYTNMLFYRQEKAKNRKKAKRIHEKKPTNTHTHTLHITEWQ